MPLGIHDVRRFWEHAPLWTGESEHEPGTKEFFEEHRRVVIDDCFAGTLDPRTLPDENHRDRVLDLGCGPGFWAVELSRIGCEAIHGTDIARAAIRLARRRCALFGVRASFTQQNAERLSFRDASFSHVNCQGVIHHTPDTEACVSEIARVLRRGGTASLSVYHRNAILQGWPLLRIPARAAARMGAGMRGRGREGIFGIDEADEVVRTYDGKDNPIGKSYTREAFLALLRPHFRIEETFVHLFPARALPWRLPRGVHRALDKIAGLMIYARVTRE